jgi:phospholipase A-2-activating protein
MYTQVTGSTDSGTLDGQSYDHVFPIEIEGQDGTVKNLKIGYNIGDNPFTTAQGFIDKHMLPQVRLTSIVTTSTITAAIAVSLL